MTHIRMTHDIPLASITEFFIMDQKHCKAYTMNETDTGNEKIELESSFYQADFQCPL